MSRVFLNGGFNLFLTSNWSNFQHNRQFYTFNFSLDNPSQVGYIMDMSLRKNYLGKRNDFLFHSKIKKDNKKQESRQVRRIQKQRLKKEIDPKNDQN